MYHNFHKNIKHRNCFNIDNNKHCFFGAPAQHIRMISKGSYETEDRSNDAENSALLSLISFL